MIGKLFCVVIDVNDLAVAERFWSAVTGWPVTLSGWHDEYSEMRQEGSSVTLLLQKVPESKSAKNRMHLDFAVDDLAAATDAVTRLGGTVVMPAGVTVTWSDDYAAAESDEPTLEWAVMADPFGNEFCLVNG